MSVVYLRGMEVQYIEKRKSSRAAEDLGRHLRAMVKNNMVSQNETKGEPEPKPEIYYIKKGKVNRIQ